MRNLNGSIIERLKQIVNARDVLGFSLQEIQEYVSIGEELEKHKQSFWATEEKAERLKELLKVEEIIEQQLLMIDHKLEHMKKIRAEVESYHQRVLEGKKKYTSE